MNVLGFTLLFALAALLGMFVGGVGSSVWWITGSVLILIAALAQAWLSPEFSIVGAVLIVIGYNSGLVLAVLVRGVLAEIFGPFRRNLRHDHLKDKSSNEK
ncbi:hypothetical protein [Mesorhizobium sp. WSM2239]|uniref:Uncharacterized protein n=2 Tax=unclassified Mesorhizobium TaxID=325217 RepID=A0AAU8DGZ8_9HYPH